MMMVLSLVRLTSRSFLIGVVLWGITSCSDSSKGNNAPVSDVAPAPGPVGPQEDLGPVAAPLTVSRADQLFMNYSSIMGLEGDNRLQQFFANNIADFPTVHNLSQYAAQSGVIKLAAEFCHHFTVVGGNTANLNEFYQDLGFDISRRNLVDLEDKDLRGIASITTKRFWNEGADETELNILTNMMKDLKPELANTRQLLFGNCMVVGQAGKTIIH